MYINVYYQYVYQFHLLCSEPVFIFNSPMLIERFPTLHLEVSPGLHRLQQDQHWKNTDFWMFRIKHHVTIFFRTFLVGG